MARGLDFIQTDAGKGFGVMDVVQRMGVIRCTAEVLFKEETETKSSVHLTMVTVDGVRRNEHSGIVQSEVTLDDLFRP